MNRSAEEPAASSVAPPHDRDLSQMPLWPELESELELAWAALRPAATEAGELLAPSEADASASPLVENPFFAAPFAPVALAGLVPGEHRLDARAEALPDADSDLGQRLRAARERAGLSGEEVARLTRITPALIRAIEEGRFEKLGATVFARGYLRSYARAVDLPDAVVGVWEDRNLRKLEDSPAPSLAATSSRRSSRQVASPILYTLLTALIAVPAYYGVRQAQRSPLPEASPPSAAAATNSESAARKSTIGGESQDANAPSTVKSESLQAPTPTQTDAEAWRQPVMASLTPMLGGPGEPEAASPLLDTRVLSVRLTAPSWVEIVAEDGRVIERSLLATGSVREYVVPRSARVRIGDVGAVELRADGKVVDLAPYTQANVATLTLDQAG